MKNKRRRIFTVILSIAMIFCSLPSTAYADGTEINIEEQIEVIEEQTEEPENQVEEAISEELDDTDGVVTEETETEEAEEVSLDKSEAGPEEESEEESDEIDESDEDIVLEATAEDGMVVTLSAGTDVFEYSEDIELKVEVVTEKVAEEASEELESETENDNVAKRVTYDIKVMHDGEEIQPLDGKTVNLKFAMSDIPSGADAVNVYHHNEETEEIETIVDDASVNEEVIDEDTVEITDVVTVEGETESFSLYTVDFTYNDKTVKLKGDTSHNKLIDVLAQLDITESIEDAKAYQDAACTNPAADGIVKNEDGEELFSVYEEDGVWYVDAINAFSTEHGLLIRTADKAEYVIKVTDETTHNNDDCITFSSDGSFELASTAKTWNGELFWSTDKVTWAEWSGGYGNELTAAQTGGTGPYKLYLYGTRDNTVITGSGQWVLIPSGSNTISCTGNIETLRGATGDNPSDTVMQDFCYANMFSTYCTSLTSAPSLPATTLSYGCYANMFYYCTGLISAPSLPATTLSISCYSHMFEGCTSLTEAPSLPATKMENGCYTGMFTGCNSLAAVPSLPIVELEDYCCYGMFLNCVSLNVTENGSVKKGMFLCPNNTIGSTDPVEMMFDGTGGTFSGTPTAGNTYYFDAPEYTVTLDGNGATTAGTASVQATYGNEMPSATMPTRTGYVFNGYYNAVSGGAKYYNADGSSAKNWDKGTGATLYAQWIKNTGSESSSHTTGWHLSGSNWQYVKFNGSFAKNEWEQIEYNGVKRWYHFGNDTMMDTGWLLDTDNSWYYLEKTNNQNLGAMTTGWMTDPYDGHRYYLDPATGKMLVGWHTVEGRRYYFNEIVPEASGWTQNSSKEWVYEKRKVTPLGAVVER